MDSDAELIAAVLKGDTASFEPLVVKYQPRVFALGSAVCPARKRSGRYCQEVFIKAFQKLSTYRGDAPFEHWLMPPGRSHVL